MAKKTEPTPWIKSDEIFVDTSEAPWMDFAYAELGKKVHELTGNDDFIKAMRVALAVERRIEELGKRLRLGSNANSDAGHYKLLQRELQDPSSQFLGTTEARQLEKRNPEISKYFKGLRTDPSYDKKARSFDIAATYESGGYGRLTAWCAAFVNWCLSQAGAPHLGYATAKSWLEFGTPVAYPVYGCLTIVKPSSSTGSTTGHVAFFVKSHGNHVLLLGGNQRGAVSEAKFKEKSVLGYRWPTNINHYLLASTGVLT